jgi:hypothetical protein
MFINESSALLEYSLSFKCKLGPINWVCHKNETTILVHVGLHFFFVHWSGGGNCDSIETFRSKHIHSTMKRESCWNILYSKYILATINLVYVTNLKSQTLTLALLVHLFFFFVYHGYHVLWPCNWLRCDFSLLSHTYNTWGRGPSLRGCYFVMLYLIALSKHHKLWSV